MLSGAGGDVQEIKILKQIVRWTPTGMELEADPRHADIVIRELGLEQAKPVTTPAVKPPKEEQEEAEELERGEARKYRAIEQD